MKRIAIVGMGKFTGALLTGWLQSMPAGDFVVCRRKRDRLEEWATKGVSVTSDPGEAVSGASWLVLGVRPGQAEAVLESLAPQLGGMDGVVSVVAGLTQEKLGRLCQGVPAFRVMPSTAAAVCQSMTCIAEPLEPSPQLEEVEKLFQALGRVAVVPEPMLDCCAVLASAGIAFSLRYLRAMAAGGVEQGLAPELAYQLAAQAMAGASALHLAAGGHPEFELDRVATPGGATIAGLLAMEKGGFSASVADGVRASSAKLRSMSR